MPLTPAQEKSAVITSVIEKPPAHPPAPAPGSMEERAARIREKWQKEGAHATIESLRPPIAENRADFSLDHAFSSGIDVHGNPTRTTEEGLRHAESKLFSDLAANFIKNGPARLSARDQGLIATRIIQAIRAFPEGNAIFAGFGTNAQREAAIRQILENPDFAAKVRVKLEEMLTKTGELANSGDLAQKKQDYQTALNEEVSIRDARDGVSTELTQIGRQYDPYRERTAGGRRGAKLAELDRLTVALPGFESSIKDNERRQARVNDEINDLRRDIRVLRPGTPERTAAEAELTAQRTERDRLQTEIEAAQEQIDRQRVLETEKTRLEGRLQQLNEKLTELQGTLTEKVANRSLKQADYLNARNSHSLSQQELQAGFRDIFSESTFEFLKERIDEAQAENDRIREEEIKNAETEDDRNILNALDHRYVRENRQPNRDIIDADYRRLFDHNGARQIVEAIIRGTNRHTPGTPEHADEEARLQARLNDPEFVRKYEMKVAQEIIARRVQTGRVTENDARYIMNSQWGQGLLEAALTRRNEIRDKLEEMLGERVTSPGFMRRLRTASGGNLLTILLLLLGTIGTAGGLYAGLRLKDALLNQN